MNKTKYMTCLKQFPKYVIKCSNTLRVSKFKYLDERIHKSDLYEVANRIRCQKLATSFRLTKYIGTSIKLPLKIPQNLKL